MLADGYTIYGELTDWTPSPTLNPQ
jgi:hypothetical protein